MATDGVRSNLESLLSYAIDVTDALVEEIGYVFPIALVINPDNTLAAHPSILGEKPMQEFEIKSKLSELLVDDFEGASCVCIASSCMLGTSPYASSATEEVVALYFEHRSGDKMMTILWVEDDGVSKRIVPHCLCSDPDEVDGELHSVDIVPNRKSYN